MLERGGADGWHCREEMENIEDLILALRAGRDLSRTQAMLAANLLASSDVTVALKKDFLIALSGKGESPVEVAAFASVFRQMAVDPGLDLWADRAIDVCGTGGDGASTFNISTAVSFLVAAGGVPVFKHGNRSITSKCGSADLMEALGIRLDLPIALLSKSIEALNFCFLFAPSFHPAFKEVMPVRKALAEEGHRSVFNLLGPLINPGKPAYQLMGVFGPEWVRPLASALDTIGLKSGLVVHCEPADGLALDELSCVGRNFASGFGELRGMPGRLVPDELGLEICELQELRGGDVSENVELLRALFRPKSAGVPKGLLDTVLLNAGAAFWVSGIVDSPHEGVDFARDLLESGRVEAWLSQARDFYTGLGES